MITADRFREFAETAARNGSPLYEEWAAGVSTDDEVMAVIDAAPESRRAPVLVFAVARILGVSLGDFATFRSWLTANRVPFLDELGRRSTQTNDVRRAAPVSLALTRIPGPVALLEVGASAGLCLYADRFAVDLGGTIVGDPTADVSITLALDGIEAGAGARLPDVVWRAGLDLDPLDPRDDEDVRWLETLLWPGQDARLDLLRRAIATARKAPALLLRGDAVDDLAALAALAPKDATLVVVSTGTLVYLPGSRRQAFVDTVTRLGARWISYEKTGSLDVVTASTGGALAGDGDRDAFATLALDGVAIGVGDAYGTTLRHR